MTYKSVALLVASCLLPNYLSAQALVEIGKVVSPSARGMERAVEEAARALSKSEGSIINFNVYKYDPGYSVVLGYKTPLIERTLERDLGVGSRAYTHNKFDTKPIFLQVAPKTRRSLGDDVSTLFKNEGDLTLPEITQMVYMWRLANPMFIPYKYSLLGQRAHKLLEEHWINSKVPLDQMEEVPNILFLNRLMSSSFTPKTYAALAAETKVYPKHVTLNADGFPVRTPESEQAYILDNYLMLAKPNMMGRFNSSNVSAPRGVKMYTPFTLTREEQAAAEKLLALREESVKIPENPTNRQLLEIAYNQLESHTIPYSSLYSTGPFFPNYEHTKLHHIIKQRIANAEESVWREDRDMSHLVVLDAIMGGLGSPEEWQNVSHINRALDAFEKLCKEVPATEANEIQLFHLRDSLLEADGIWEYMPDSHMSRSEFTQLEVEELSDLRDRVRQFSKATIKELMRTY